MSKSMVAVITAVITAVVSVCSTLVVVKYTGEDGTEKEVRAEIQYEENGGDSAGFEPYELSGGQQTVSGDTSMYKVDIKSARISVDTIVDGEPADVKSVLVTFSYTNNSDEVEDFHGAVKYAVYQNGVALEDAYDDVYDVRNDDGIEFDEIKPGTTIEFELGFHLKSESSDLVVEVVNHDYDPEFLVSRTFTLS